MDLLIKCETKDTLPLSDLTEFQGELKNLTDKNYQKFKKQLFELGFSAPFFVWKDKGKNYLLDGHQRKRTLSLMEKEGTFIPPLPVVFVEAKDRKEAKKKVLAFTSQYGQMTDEGLSAFAIDAELNLQDLDSFHFPEIKLDKFQIEGASDYDAQCDEDEVPEVVEPICKLGDIWQLGDHRLMCGDSTDKATVEKLMNGEKADLMLTDPPYGVNYDANWRNEAAEKGMIRYGTSKNLGKVSNDDRADWTEAYKNIGAQVVYIWHAGRFSSLVQNNIESIGYEIVSQIIWSKPTFAISRGDYHWQHEPCWYAVRRGAKHNWQGARDQSTVWDIKRDTEVNGHGTPKPIELCERSIANNTSKGQNVADPFGGSGSTLIACEKTNRKCFMMELDPHYCDVIISRWQKFSGKIAEKVSAT